MGPPPDASDLCGREAAPGNGLACSPRLPDCWSPAWKPPRKPAHACTESQILDEVTKCFGDTFDPGCDVFSRDPVNGACLECIFSTSDEPTYGAVILLSNASWESNVPGCLALVDGDASASGCGAKAAAYDECSHTACASTCSTYEMYATCW